MLSQTKKVFFVIGALLLSTVATASTVKSVTVPANTAPKQPILIQVQCQLKRNTSQIC